MKINIGLISLGCSKNLVDAETMLGLLTEADYAIVSNPEEANVLIVNTCGFIDSAKEESINTILEMAEYKKERCKLLIVTGCMAERYAKEIFEELPEVDAVVGTGDYEEIVSVLKRAFEGEKVSLCGHINNPLSEGLPRMLTTPSYTAYLKIAEGCDNRCTYCAIPYIRGTYRSRPMESLIEEARRLADGGARELIVIAQDTTRYGLDLYGERKLAELLKALCTIEKLKWIRVHYCYPEQITQELIDVIAQEEKICKYLDIPIQHCSDSVLKRMGRKGTKAELVALLQKLREEIPNLVIRTSLIVGFPGETEEQFCELYNFVKEMRFDRMGVFKYSKEEGTPAEKLPCQVDESIKDERYHKLMELQNGIAKEINESKIGSVQTVLLEGFDGLLYYGRTYADSLDIDQTVYFGAMEELTAGSFVPVTILHEQDYDLMGEMVK